MKRLIVGIAMLLVAAGVALAQDITTRFGALSVEDGVLLFKGKPVSPEVKANAGLTQVEKFEMGSSDVLLFRMDGGTACPGLFHFVSVSAEGAKATKAFGTCSHKARVAQNNDSVTVSMSGYRGPLEPAAARAKAAKELHVFTFNNGVVTENGKHAQ